MNKKWFRRKRYGYGWYPASWEGWLVTLGHILLVIGGAQFYAVHMKLGIVDETRLTIAFLAGVVLVTAILIKIAIVKGESPRWQWGEDSEDGNK